MNCPNCGKELNDKQRVCMNCGSVNPYHPDNVKAMEFLKEHQVDPSVENPLTDTVIITGSGFSKFLFGLVNCALIIAVLLSLYAYTNDIVTTVIYSAFINFYIICLEVLVQKAERPWWVIFIPLYNLYVLSEIAFTKGIFFLFLLLGPLAYLAAFYLGADNIMHISLTVTYIVSALYFIIFMFFLSRRFNTNPFYTVIFFFVFIPLIAFSSKIHYA